MIKTKHLVAKVMKYLLGVFLTVIIIRLAFFDCYLIPTDSMSDTIKPGDFVVINKTSYSGIFSAMLRKINLNSTLRPNDIVVFKLTAGGYDYWVKRCIALPGDTVEINDGIVFVNRHVVVDPPGVRRFYKIWYKNFRQVQSLTGELQIDRNTLGFKRFPKYILSYLNQTQIDRLSKTTGVDSIVADPLSAHSTDMISLVPAKASESIQSFGPVIVPCKGWRLKLDSVTFKQYESMFRWFEGVNITSTGGNQFYQNGKRVYEYTFKDNCFFMLGDNRDNSFDSRNFGFVPEQIITGTILKILHR